MRKVKFALACALVVVVAAGVVTWRLERLRAAAPPPAGAARLGGRVLTRVPVREERLTLAERLKPGRRRTRGEELLAAMPAGTEAYEVRTPGEAPVVIYRSPAGDVLVPPETRAEVAAYRKLAPFAALEARPAAFAYADLGGAGAGGGVGLVRLGRVHLGAAAACDTRRTWSAGTLAAVNVWRNVDAGVYAGKALGRGGWRGGVAVALAVR